MRNSGREPVRDTGKYAQLYRRQPDGAWKVVIGVFSRDLPSR